MRTSYAAETYSAFERRSAQAHYPDDEESKETARTRLAFDELFLIQLRVLAKKRDWQLGQEARPIPIDSALTQSFVDSLPFPLTNAQSSALEQVTGDMQGPRPMARLLQGDVGSGKTVVATGALLQAVASGAQGAIMVPTEILAEQHFRTICGLLGKEPVSAGETKWSSPLTRFSIGQLESGFSSGTSGREPSAKCTG